MIIKINLFIEIKFNNKKTRLDNEQNIRYVRIIDL
jgi:hypothetical protein